MQKCKKCEQYMDVLADSVTVPCSNCGYLDGNDVLDELPAEEPTEPSQFRRNVRYLAMIFVLLSLVLLLSLLVVARGEIASIIRIFLEKG